MPPVWRQILLRADASFLELHEAIQDLGWDDAHLWSFYEPQSRRVLAGVGERGWFGEKDPDAGSVRLDRHLARESDSCLYVYDFGDHWEHEVTLEAMETHEGGFERALLDGAGEFPPEDCGGIPGFMRLREYRTTGKDPWGDDEVLREWLGETTWSEFDLPQARARFGHVLANPGGAVREEQVRADGPEGLKGIDEPVMDSIMEEVNRLLEGLAERHGVAALLNKVSYSEINARIEFELALVRQDGIVLDKHAEEFINRCEDFGLDLDDLGREFSWGDGPVRIVGLRPRAKEPIICERVHDGPSRGDRVRVSAAVARKYLAASGASGSSDS